MGLVLGYLFLEISRFELRSAGEIAEVSRWITACRVGLPDNPGERDPAIINVK